MHKVFAVIIFTLFFFSSLMMSTNSETVLPVYSTFKNNAIYSAPGDFDGDGDLESMFITKPDTSYYISILDKDRIIHKELDYQVNDFKLTIQDVNKDKKEDIILNVIQNNCENCFVYTADVSITTLLSPDIIKSKISFDKIWNYIALECGSFYLPHLENSAPHIKLFYTEMDYEGDASVFISEGAIYNKNINILTIQTTISIDSKGNVMLKKVHMLPVKNNLGD